MVLESYDTALALSHLASHLVVDGVGGLGCHFLQSLAQHTLLEGVNQVVALLVYNEAVRLLLSALLEAFVILGVYPLVPQSEPFQRHVSSQHAHLAPMMVADVCKVGGGELLRGGSVIIGWGPVAFRLLEGFLVPLVGQEVGVLLVHLPASDHVLWVAPGVYLEIVPAVWIDVWLEDQPAARHIHILSHHTLQMGLQFVGVVDVALYAVDIVYSSHIYVRQHSSYLLVLVEYDAVIARLCLTCHRVFGDVIDCRHDSYRHYYQHYHDSQAKTVSKSLFLVIHFRCSFIGCKDSTFF